MTVIAKTISVPSNGTPVVVLTNEPSNAGEVNLRNIGTVTVLLGGAAGALYFPLNAGEYLGLQVSPDDTLLAEVATTGTAGSLVTLVSN